MKGFTRLANTDFVFQEFESVEGSSVEQNGKSLIDFGTSAYLGLSFDITNEDLEVARKWGLRNHWSRISGNNALTRELEIELEKGTGIDCVRLAQSISLINLTILKSIGRLFDSILIDEDAHITIKLGTGVLSKKDKVSYFPNNDIAFLEEKFLSMSNDSKKLIIIDGVYSMKGNLAKVSRLLELCKKYNAYLLIDDAHGFGVIGEKGHGVIDSLPKEDLDRVIYVGSFSKCASNPVAFIGFNKELKTQIDNYTPCLIYSGPPSNLHVGISLRHFKNFTSNEFREKRELIKYFSKRLHHFCQTNNIKTLSSSDFPLLSASIKEKELENIIEILKRVGIFAKPAIFPVVRRGDEIIRFSLTAMHSLEQISTLESALYEARHLFNPMEIN